MGGKTGRLLSGGGLIFGKNEAEEKKIRRVVNIRVAEKNTRGPRLGFTVQVVFLGALC